MLRAFVLASPLAAVGCTRAAANDPPLEIELLIAGLAVVCAARPDNHIGLLVVVLIGLDWVLTVDDPTTPWSIGVAVSLAVLHTSMAAASVAPHAAPWTRAMYHRWTRRLIAVAGASLPAWAVTAAIHRSDVPSSPALLTAALMTLAVAALWARHGNLRIDPPM